MQIARKVLDYGTLKEVDVTDDYQTLVDTTNLSALTRYYPSADGISMEGYSKLLVQGMISGGVTATIEASLDNAASPDFVDVTKAGLDLITNVAGGASFVDTNFMLKFIDLKAAKIRIKSVTSDGSNAVQYNLSRSN